MTKSKKTLLFATIIVLTLSLGWYLVLYQPEATKLNTLKKDTKNLLIKIQSIRVTDRQIAALESQIKVLDHEIADVQGKVLLKSELPGIVSQLERKGKTFGLKFHSIIPDYDSLIKIPNEEEASDLLKLTVHFKLQGYYKNFGNFIDSLGELPFVISLGEISLYYDERIYPELEINMDAVLYLRETPGNKYQNLTDK
ncbi:MAG: type 4a pilus biogenesis protein PilO [bacterium]